MLSGTMLLWFLLTAAPVLFVAVDIYTTTGGDMLRPPKHGKGMAE